MRDRVYEGHRVRWDFVVVVTDFETHYAVHQRQLKPHGLYSPCGFGWGYDGAGSRELAYALLLDHYDDPVRAEQYADEFAKHVVSKFSGKGFRLLSKEIGERMTEIRDVLHRVPATVEFEE